MAQKAPFKFGDVSMDELKMTKYEKDSSAAAVILGDYGESIISYTQGLGFQLIFERLTRIKILTKDGLDRANISIPLYHEGSATEKLTGLKAVTYNLENGKEVESKAKSDAIFKEKYDANRDFMKITWPNTRVGSVIEITYKVTSDFLFNFQDWEFQDNIPVVWSEYRARIPEYYTYDKYTQGYVALAVNEETQITNSIHLTSVERSGGGFSGAPVNSTFSNETVEFQEKHFRWVATNVPAFTSEPFMTTYRDYVSKINFELASTKFPNQPIKKYMGSWEDINTRYAEDADFGGEVTGNGFLKRTVEEITAGITSPEDKIGAIFNYVSQNVAWDGTNRKFLSTSIKKVLEDKKGNSAEINLLLASMLEKAGFSVSPVLLSTRDHGFLREHIPVSTQFNYVICLVRSGEKSILLDATERLLPSGVLPERCLNGNGFAVSKAGYQWVKLLSSAKSKTLVNADLTLASSGELKGKLQIDRSGYAALGTRKKYFSKGESDYLKDFLGSRPWEVSKSEFQNAKEIQKSFTESHDVTVSDHVMVAGDVLYVNPFILLREESNPFKLEKREYPVDFGTQIEKMYLGKFTIPEGFRVDEIPQSRVLVMPDKAAKYVYNITQIGNTVSIMSNLQINKTLFAQEEYPNLREFYNQVIAKQAEQIVLKKK